MRIILSIILCLALPFQTFAAPSFADAEKAYAEKDYNGAAQMFEACFKAEFEKNPDNPYAVTSDAYYNLGNCYYRMKDYAHAILNYQKALRMNPANEDAAFNLELTQAKITDDFDAPSEMFFISWFKSVVHAHNHTTWGLWGLFFLAVTFALILCFMLGQRIWLRKVGFFGAILSGILLVFSEAFAYAQYRRFNHLEMAVVMQTVDTFDTPTSSAKKQITLHEGTTVLIKENYKDEWFHVELPDGSKTWMKNTGIEKV